MKTLGTIAAALLVATAANAQEAAPRPEQPSPEAIRSFWAFYFKGQGGGAALAEAKLCVDLVRDGPNKYECTREVPATGIKAGEKVVLWQAYLLPIGEVVENLKLEVREGETIRETRDLKLKGDSIRTRNFTTVRIPKAGKWTLRLLRGAEELRSFTLTAS